MKKYTKIIFLIGEERVTKYFEGCPSISRIVNVIGKVPIVYMERITGEFQADYIKDKSKLCGYYTV